MEKKSEANVYISLEVIPAFFIYCDDLQSCGPTSVPFHCYPIPRWTMLLGWNTFSTVHSGLSLLVPRIRL